MFHVPNLFSWFLSTTNHELRGYPTESTFSPYRAEKHHGPDSRLQLSAILGKWRDLVCGEFEGELLGVTRDKKGEDACKGESSDSGTLKRAKYHDEFSW